MKFITGFLTKRKIRSQFGTVVSCHILNQLQNFLSPVVTHGELAEITFLTCTVKFSQVSDQCITASDTVAALRIFYSHMKNIILANHGTVNSVNDGVITAFWNAPVCVHDHREQEIKCALVMRQSMSELNRTHRSSMLVIDAIVSVATAESVVGNTGSADAWHYTCVGKAVREANSLCNQADRYKVMAMACSDTVKHLDTTWVTAELDETTHVHALLDQYPQMATPDHIKIARATHRKFLTAYREQRYDMAIKIAHSLKSAWNYKLRDYYTTMISQCELMRSQMKTQV